MVLQKSSALSSLFYLVNTLHLDSRHHVKLVLQKPETKLISEKLKIQTWSWDVITLLTATWIYLLTNSSINFYFHIWLTFQTYNWWWRNETENSWKFRLWFEKQSRSDVRRIDPYSSLTLGRCGRAAGVWQSLAAWVCQWLSNGKEWNSYLQKSSPQVRPSAIYTQVFQIFSCIWISSWSCDLRVSS